MNVVGILGILVDDGIRLVIVPVGAGEVLFGCEDVDFDVLVEAFDIVDRLLGQFEDLVAGQVEADREALDDNRRDDVDQDDRRDKQTESTVAIVPWRRRRERFKDFTDFSFFSFRSLTFFSLFILRIFLS